MTLLNSLGFWVAVGFGAFQLAGAFVGSIWDRAVKGKPKDGVETFGHFARMVFCSFVASVVYAAGGNALEQNEFVGPENIWTEDALNALRPIGIVFVVVAAAYGFVKPTVVSKGDVDARRALNNAAGYALVAALCLLRWILP